MRVIPEPVDQEAARGNRAVRASILVAALFEQQDESRADLIAQRGERQLYRVWKGRRAVNRAGDVADQRSRRRDSPLAARRQLSHRSPDLQPRGVPHRLRLVTNRYHRRQHGRTPRRNDTRGKRNQRQDRRRGGKGRHVRRRDAVEHAGQPWRRHQPRSHADDHAHSCPGADRDQRVANDEPDRGGPRGAERQPHANLLRSLRHDERHHAEQTDDREEQGDRAEAARQRRQHPFGRQGARNLILDCRQTDERQRRVDIGDRCANRGQRGFRFPSHPEIERTVPCQRPSLRKREEQLFGRIAHVACVEVVDQSDDLDRHGRVGPVAVADPMTDRAAAAKVSPCETLVDDDRADAGGVDITRIALVEVAAGDHLRAERREEPRTDAHPWTSAGR